MTSSPAVSFLMHTCKALGHRATQEHGVLTPSTTLAAQDHCGCGGRRLLHRGCEHAHVHWVQHHDAQVLKGPHFVSHHQPLRARQEPSSETKGAH